VIDIWYWSYSSPIHLFVLK